MRKEIEEQFEEAKNELEAKNIAMKIKQAYFYLVKKDLYLLKSK